MYDFSHTFDGFLRFERMKIEKQPKYSCLAHTFVIQLNHLKERNTRKGGILMTVSISVDCGRGHIKVASYTERRELRLLSFPNRVEKGEKERMGNSHLVNYHGIDYRLGEGTSQISTDSLELDKLTEDYKLNIYTAVALMLDKLKKPSVTCSVNLKVNVPLSLYKSETERERYKNFFNEKDVNIRVNGRMYSFRINSVEVFFEGSGFLLTNNLKLDERKEYFTIIDFGSLNLTYAEFDDELSPNVHRCGSLFAGSHLVINRLYRLLNDRGYRYENYEIHAYLQNRKAVPNKVAELINNEVRDYLEKNVFAKLDAIDWYGKIYFTGGSSLLFKKFIEEKMEGKNYEISENAWYDNAVGFLEFDEVS